MAYETIDPRAPLQATHSLAIQAPATRVWSHLVDIGQWTRTVPHIHAASIDAGLEPGATLRWRSFAATTTALLREVTPPHRLVWTGRSSGSQSVQIWDLTPQGDATLVTTAQSLRGWKVTLFAEQMRRTLDSSLVDWLAALKAASEA